MTQRFALSLAATVSLAVLWHGWVSDDAFIIFRVLDNAVNGFGLRWNVIDRVQVFTCPLWTLTLLPLYALTREVLFTSTLLSTALTFATLWLLVRHQPRFEGALTAGAFVLSRALFDFSTSGLENPLSHFLVVAGVVLFVRRAPLWQLGLVTALLLLNRLEHVLLLAPLWLLTAKEQGLKPRDALPAVPVLAWYAFSLSYFGFLAPNTAWAKLATHEPLAGRLTQGGWYLWESLTHDPLTIALIAAALWFPRARVCLLALLGFVVFVGGDFMSGRFLSAAAVFSLAILSQQNLRVPVRPALAAIVALIILGIARPHRDERFHGIANERFYYWVCCTVEVRAQGATIGAPVIGEVAEWKDPLQVIESAGQSGYFGGPGFHLVDIFALGDPLLARIPGPAGQRIGHVERPIPDGYLDTLRTGENRLLDPELRARWERLALITRGPLWTKARWKAIAQESFGLNPDP